jgi:putative inorganic carbon (HCO3(-)) transporter
MKLTPKFLITVAFNFLILSVPLYFRFSNEELFEFNKMILVYGITLLIGSLWLVRMILEKKLVLKRTPLDFPIAVFVFSQIISTVFSIHPHTSLFGYYSRFNGGLLSTLAYVTLFYAFVSNIKKKDLGSFLLTAFISGLAVSLYGILEHFGHSVSCLVLPSNKTFGVDCWVQDVQSRVFASFGQPNWLAAYVITLFPLSAVAATQKNLSIFKRSLFVVTSLALFLVLLYTRSRSGIIGLAVGLMVLGAGVLFLAIKNKKELLKNLHLPTAVVIIVSLVIISLISGTGFTPSISTVYSNKQNANQEIKPQPVVNRLEQGGTDSGEIRKIVWTGAYKVWQRYPIIGSGVETFAYSYYQDRIREHNDVSEWDFLYNKAHNELLNILATTGIVGLITYLSIFATVTIITLKIVITKTYSNIEKLMALSLLSGQAALFTSNFFGFSTVSVNVLMYIFFAITCIIYAGKKNKDNKIKSNKKVSFVLENGSQYFGLTLVAIFFIVLSFRNYNYWAADKAYAQGKAYFNAGQYQYGIQQLLEAINRSPNEAIYFDTLSNDYAKLAVHFHSINEATAAAQMLEETLAASSKVMQLNNRHLNFYKTRARVMVTLSQIDEKYVLQAESTLLKAIELSPTDPKLIYTLAVIKDTQNEKELALKLYEQAVSLKPNYERPYWKMSEIYEAQEQYQQAIESLNFILENIDSSNQKALEKIETIQNEL